MSMENVKLSIGSLLGEKSTVRRKSIGTRSGAMQKIFDMRSFASLTFLIRGFFAFT